MKLFLAQSEEVEGENLAVNTYEPLRAIELARENSRKNGKENQEFEGFNIFIRLNVDPKQGDQNVRGTCVLPHGTGKKTRVCVFAPETFNEKLTEMGVDIIGTEEILQKAVEGEVNFDKIIATTEQMKLLKVYARQLGPMGLMPSIKGGTLVKEEELESSIKLLQQGQVEFK